MPNTMSGSLLGLHSALVVVLSALGFAMAVWVYRANPRERENQGFSLMVLFIVSWVSCYHLAQLGNPTFWFRLAAFAVSMFFVTYYFFIVRVVSRQDRAAVPAPRSRHPGLWRGHGRLGPRYGHRH